MCIRDSLWAEKLCLVYRADPVLRLGDPTEAGHEDHLIPIEEAFELLANPGDRAFTQMFQAQMRLRRDA